MRRILAARYRPEPDSAGSSWLTVLGHAKDSLWSLDLFRCESAVLRTHWVLVVMDQFTRRIVGIGVHRGTVDGRALCRMNALFLKDLAEKTHRGLRGRIEDGKSAGLCYGYRVGKTLNGGSVTTGERETGNPRGGH